MGMGRERREGPYVDFLLMFFGLTALGVDPCFQVIKSDREHWNQAIYARKTPS